MRKLKYHKNDLDKTIQELVDFVIEDFNAAKGNGTLSIGRSFCDFSASNQFYRDFWHRHIEILDAFETEFDRRMGRHIELDLYVSDPPAPRWHYRGFFSIAPFTWDCLD